MAFIPVSVTNGVDVALADTAAEYTQYLWLGWIPVGGTYDPPLPDGSPGPSVPTIDDFTTMMDQLYVRKDDLVIAPEPPATPKGPGTIFIDNSTEG